MSFTFRTAYGGPVISQSGADRQGRAVKAAVAALGSANARAFLNAHHEGLRGRPLDLAVGSDSGLSAVETALCVEARRGLDSC